MCKKTKHTFLFGLLHLQPLFPREAAGGSTGAVELSSEATVAKLLPLWLATVLAVKLFELPGLFEESSQFPGPLLLHLSLPPLIGRGA